MKKLLEGQFVVLAPDAAAVPSTLRQVTQDNYLHRSRLTELQKLRGSIYLRDGAITADELTDDGCHRTAADEVSWHVLALDAHGSVCACLRFVEETGARYEDLGISRAAVARCPTWGARLRLAIQRQLARAVTQRLRFGEVGGWAVSELRRGSIEAFRLILAAYGLLELLGGCIGVATATQRHESAGILRRIGLRPLAVDGLSIPVYYDERYGCQMEVLEFDSRRPNQRYQELILGLRAQMRVAPVICRETSGIFRAPAVQAPALMPAFFPESAPLNLGL